MLAGFVPQEELSYWYRAADAFVYPSQYEGFGIPVLEAMAAGTPVITSNVSALPEVAGGAAILTDPHDEAALQEALVHVLTDASTRAELRALGVTRAHEFSWQHAAVRTANSYRRALSAEVN